MGKPRHFIVPVPTWNSDLHVMVGEDQARWRKLMLAQRVEPQNADNMLARMAECKRGAQTMWEEKTPWNVFAYFPNCPRPSDAGDLASVAHELLHATVRILTRKGVRLSDESEEAFTYTLEYLTREFWWRLAGKHK